MIRILATTFAGLLGLAFGSFLNVCVSRWPAGESVVTPRSHCRGCARTLTWWENVPLVSWLALRGRCRTCGMRISARYVLVEAAVGALWALAAWRYSTFATSQQSERIVVLALAALLGKLILGWMLVALAALDAEWLWLPDWLTWPGIGLGFVYSLLPWYLIDRWPLMGERSATRTKLAWISVESAMMPACIVLVIWAVYWLVRRKEGIGLGDAKLMAMLGAWLGFPGALLSFGVGVVLGAVAAVLMLLRGRSTEDRWAAGKLPLGTFLCIGGIVSSLWGQQIISDYLRWAGF